LISGIAASEPHPTNECHNNPLVRDTTKLIFTFKIVQSVTYPTIYGDKIIAFVKLRFNINIALHSKIGIGTIFLKIYRYSILASKIIEK